VPASTPPPSSAIPGKSGGAGPYIGGVLLLAVLIGGLVCWKMKSAPGDNPAPAPIVSMAQPEPQPTPQFAPPPPPKIEEEDAGTDAGPKVAGTGKGGTPSPTGCGGKCDFASGSALNSALTSTARSAQGCYNRALRTSEVSGSLTVSVQVGPNGQVCSAGIVNDSVHSGEISSCVLGRFRGKTFPAPQGGCATVNIPINFTIKQ
jgi:outer membrane biosynthesis protein TonB